MSKFIQIKSFLLSLTETLVILMMLISLDVFGSSRAMACLLIVLTTVVTMALYGIRTLFDERVIKEKTKK